jgi:hypothetical protein
MSHFCIFFSINRFATNQSLLSLSRQSNRSTTNKSTNARQPPSIKVRERPPWYVTFIKIKTGKKIEKNVKKSTKKQQKTVKKKYNGGKHNQSLAVSKHLSFFSRLNASFSAVLQNSVSQ